MNTSENQKSQSFIVKPDGTVEYTGFETGSVSSVFGPGRVFCKERASHIVPEDFLRRWAFIALRRAFGDSGRVSDWTRNWKCRWTVRFTKASGVPEYWNKARFVFDDRADALAMEQALLEKYFYKIENNSVLFYKTGT